MIELVSLTHWFPSPVNGRLHLARYPSQVYMNAIIMVCIMLITIVTCLAKDSLNRHETANVEYRA